MLEAGNRHVELLGTGDTLFIMHADHGEGEAVYNVARSEAGRDFTLAAVSGIDWERELSPWPEKAVFKKAPDFGGGADSYLRELEENIVPYILANLDERPKELYIVGYSLAGLFALYSAYKTELFDGVVCASGSMWYPRFEEFALSSRLSERVKRVYLSLGDKEAKTKNAVMQTVQDKTQRVYEHLRSLGLETAFEMNKGGHFADDAGRLAKGIAWILNSRCLYETEN